LLLGKYLVLHGRQELFSKRKCGEGKKKHHHLTLLDKVSDGMHRIVGDRMGEESERKFLEKHLELTEAVD
jgi:hypothetical protein